MWVILANKAVSEVGTSIGEFSHQGGKLAQCVVLELWDLQELLGSFKCVRI